MLAAIGTDGLWRGCTDWQQACAEYQQRIGRLPRLAADWNNGTGNAIPDFISSYHD